MPLVQAQKKLEKKKKIDLLTTFFRKKTTTKDKKSKGGASGSADAAEARAFEIAEADFDVLVLDLLAKLPQGKQKSKHEVYEHSFLGSTLVQYLQSNFASVCPTAVAARNLAQYLMQRNVLEAFGAESFGEKQVFRFRLSEADSLSHPTVANDLKNWPYQANSALEVVTSLLERFIRLLTADENVRRMSSASKDSSLSSSSSGQKWSLLDKKDLYFISLELAQLQGVDLTPLTDMEKRLFFVNLFNLMVLYGHARFGVPRNGAQRAELFDNMYFVVDGQQFALTDIRDGILLGIRKYGENEPLSKFVVPTDYQLVVFALSDGTKSSPSIQIFYPETCIYTFKAQAKSFLHDTVSVNAKGEISIPVQVEEFAQAFTKNKKLEALVQLEPYLSADINQTLAELTEVKKQQTISIHVLPYDYNLSYL